MLMTEWIQKGGTKMSMYHLMSEQEKIINSFYNLAEEEREAEEVKISKSQELLHRVLKCGRSAEVLDLTD